MSQGSTSSLPTELGWNTDMAAQSSSRTEWMQLLGSVWLYGGLGVFSLAVIDGVSQLPFTMPDIWYGNQMIWTFFSIIAIVAGMGLSKREERLDWSPTRSGRRFDTLVLYTRDHCPLCDEAKAILRSYSRWLPASVEVDINEDPELFEQFTNCVPVVQIDGRVRFRGRISETLLRRLIEGTTPGGSKVSSGCGSGSCGSGKCGSGKCSSGKCGTKSGACGSGKCREEKCA
jgi:glutaredoxin